MTSPRASTPGAVNTSAGNCGGFTAPLFYSETGAALPRALPLPLRSLSPGGIGGGKHPQFNAKGK